MPQGMSFQDVMSFINSMMSINSSGGPDMSEPQMQEGQGNIPQIEPGLVTKFINHLADFLSGGLANQIGPNNQFTPANQVGGGAPTMNPNSPQALFQNALQAQSAFNASNPPPGVGSPAQYMTGGTP